MNNYIKDSNPLDLQGPPVWWLTKLHDFDDSLVLLPSRMGYFYRLAQRRAKDPRAKLTHSLSADTDSRMLERYGLVPVTTIIATCRWDNPLMWEDLQQRCPSRMGGAAKYEQLVNEQEQMKLLRERAERDDMLDRIAKDSLGFYKKKAGLQTQMYIPKVKDRIIQPTNRSAAIKVIGKYDSLEKHIKRPFSQK